MSFLRRIAVVTLSAGALAACGGTRSTVIVINEATDGGDERHDSGFEITPFVDGGSGGVDGRGGRPDGGVGAGRDGTASSGKYDALPPPPQVINSDGGVLKNPELIAIFFSNDNSNEPMYETFYMGLGTSSVWKAATEYGVGPATATIVKLTEAAPATIDDTPDQQGDNTALQTWLLNEISSKALPAPGPNTTYMINYPPGTKVTASGTGCQDFDGYHEDIQNSDNVVFAYGVVPRCTDQGSTESATFTSTVTHEAIEAATDPYPDYSAAWAQADSDHLDFDEANEGSEVADMCENDPEAYYQFSDFPFTVQRIWSNKAVLAGHDPCVPELPNTVFFNAVPELPDMGVFNYSGTPVQTSSVHIPVGGTATVYLDLYTDGVIPDFDVNVLDLNEFNNGDPSQNLLTISMATTTGNNGDRIPVTITVKTAGNENTNGEVNNTEMFAIIASQGTSDTAPAHYWYGLITN